MQKMNGKPLKFEQDEAGSNLTPTHKETINNACEEFLKKRNMETIGMRDIIHSSVAQAKRDRRTKLKRIRAMEDEYDEPFF